MSIISINSNYNNHYKQPNRASSSLSNIGIAYNVNTSNENIPLLTKSECNRVTSATIGKPTNETEIDSIYNTTSPRGSSLLDHISGKSEAPYAYLADENGIINYKGVTFVCDNDTKSLCLGDVSNQKNVLIIPLSGGGTLKVNRDNLGDLSRAISMFSPKDINLIMRAIAQDTKIQEMQIEIDDATNSLGGSADARTSVDNTVDSNISNVTDEMINSLLQDRDEKMS